MNDPDLDRLLRTWVAPDAPADDFRRGVRERIATQTQAPATPRWLAWLNVLVRPRLVFTTIIAALIAGTVAGAAHAPFKLKDAPVTMTDSIRPWRWKTAFTAPVSVSVPLSNLLLEAPDPWGIILR